MKKTKQNENKAKFGSCVICYETGMISMKFFDKTGELVCFDVENKHIPRRYSELTKQANKYNKIKSMFQTLERDKKNLELNTLNEINKFIND